MVYFVATPIGNLQETTYRAVEVLSSVSAIFCEDTRHSQVFLHRFGIQKPLYPHHKFNEKSVLDFALSFARRGEDVAVISDAGMPAVSDPGNLLINALIRENLPYTVVSGACALINAFVLSGFLPPFAFVGFLPEKNVDRERLLAKVNTNGVLIFYVSVHDLKKDFAYLYSVLGDRRACLVKEISKLHEKVTFCRLSDEITDDKGEFVLVVDGNEQNPLCDLSPEEHLRHYLDAGVDRQDAVKRTAKDRGVPKNEIYKLLLK